ncbi:hypothetical protein PanWU01x14_109500 [Parasponia andersonii]|uniref:Uncharacterized protein n=1 Tax=Parasponia andersonii TaxID=3476 RepID=A0A2P5CZR5_PARAD|nr:hypothetical protein PanWU01x14_109500 [Parasponia andersonii]
MRQDFVLSSPASSYSTETDNRNVKSRDDDGGRGTTMVPSLNCESESHDVIDMGIGSTPDKEQGNYLPFHVVSLSTHHEENKEVGKIATKHSISDFFVWLAYRARLCN